MVKFNLKQRVGILSITDVFRFLELNISKITLLGYKINLASQRLFLFKRDGLQCVTCSRVGAYFAIEKDSTSSSYHLNLYAADGELMTKDHIVPLSKGGANHFSNLQPMCYSCNQAKGNATHE